MLSNLCLHSVKKMELVENVNAKVFSDVSNTNTTCIILTCVNKCMGSSTSNKIDVFRFQGLNKGYSFMLVFKGT